MFFPESFFHTFFVTPFCIYNLSAVALPALLSQGICSLIGAFSQCISPGLHFAVRSKCCAFFTVGLSPYHPTKIAYALCKHGIWAFAVFRCSLHAFRSPRSAFRSASRKLKFSRCRAFALSYNKNLICFVQAQHMGFLLYGTAQCLRTLYHIPL